MTNATIIEKHIDNPAEVGAAKFEYIFWDVYFATLIASNGKFDANQPFALSLRYLRDFEGGAIVQRSVVEMKKQGLIDKQQLNEWELAMMDLFPDVKQGQTITGVSGAGGRAIFYLDETELGIVEDEAFTQRFFDIWLSEKTSEPRLREKLLKL